MTVNQFDAIEFAENPDPRCPVVAVMDCSDSMDRTPAGESRTSLDILSGSLDTLVSSLYGDTLSRRRVELSFVPYGTQPATPTPFATVDNILNGSSPLPDLHPMGITNTGAALTTALNAIEERKATYKQQGVSYYQGILLLISDGLATDNVEEVSKRIADLEAQKKLSFFAVGVEGASIEQLSKIGNPNKTALPLKGTNFDELFVWLSASAASVSASTPGDSVAVPSPAGWAEM